MTGSTEPIDPTEPIASPGWTAPPDDRRRARRRRMGLGLFAFGVTGIGLLLASTLLLAGSVSAIGDALTGFQQQKAEIVALLEPAANVLDSAADSVANAGTSLQAASGAAFQASQLTARVAESFEGLAALGTFEILGNRPFEQLTAGFSGVATEARALTTDLAEASEALTTSVADTQAVATDLRALADQLAELEASLEAPAVATTGGAPVALAVLVLFGMLVWLAVPAVGSTWVGWRLWRGSEPLPRG